MLINLQTTSTIVANDILQTKDPPKPESDFTVVPIHINVVNGSQVPSTEDIQKNIEEMNDLYHVHHVIFSWDGKINILPDPRPPASDGMGEGDIELGTGDVEKVATEAKSRNPDGVHIIVCDIKDGNATHFWDGANGVSILGSNTACVDEGTNSETWAHEMLHGLGGLSHGSEQNNPNPPPPSGWDADGDGNITEADRNYLLWGRARDGDTGRTGTALTEAQHQTIRDMAKNVSGASVKKYFVITGVEDQVIKNASHINDTKGDIAYNKTHIIFGLSKGKAIDISDSESEIKFHLNNLSIFLTRFKLILKTWTDNLTLWNTAGGWPINMSWGYLINNRPGGCMEYPFSIPGMFDPDFWFRLETDTTGNVQLNLSEWIDGIGWSACLPNTINWWLDENITRDPQTDKGVVNVFEKDSLLLEGTKQLGLQEETPINQTAIIFDFNLESIPDLNNSLFQTLHPVSFVPFTTYEENETGSGFIYDLSNATPGLPVIAVQVHEYADPLSHAPEWVMPIADLGDYQVETDSSIQLTAYNFTPNCQYTVTLFYSSGGVLQNTTLASGTTSSTGEIHGTISLPTLDAGTYLIKIQDSENRTDYTSIEITETTEPQLPKNPAPIPGFSIILVITGTTLAIGLWSRKKREH